LTSDGRGTAVPGLARFGRSVLVGCPDHRADDFVRQLEAACPAGIDVYFENVGGAVQQAVWPLLNDFARVPVCGLISQYSATTPMPGPDMFSDLPPGRRISDSNCPRYRFANAQL
jgi:NADPH-dependent curcumin reductase CurA